jgi:hypothetical protein
MASTPPAPMADHDADAIVRGGPAYRVAERLGLTRPDPQRRALKVGLLVLLTWVPLVVLAGLEGHALGPSPRVSLLRDPVVYSRFLFVVPLLELAGVAVATGLAAQVSYFLASGLVPGRELPRFEAARAEVVQLRGSVLVEVVILLLALVLAYATQVVVGVGAGETSWKRSGGAITAAGWWYIVVSLPVLFFFLLQWAWVLALWGWFLARVARLDLALTPTHADRAAGLGFLAWGLSSFAGVLMAVSAVMSGGFAAEIMHRGGSLNSLKYHVVVFVVIALAVLHAPLLAFVGRLSTCRWQALFEYGSLCLRHDRAFSAKWVTAPHGDADADAKRGPLLGCPDVSTMADIAAAYDRVQRMQVIPFDRSTLLTLVVAALIPMVPLLGTAIPMQDILSKLAALMM